jgi:acyl-homoserine lactone acylase PvdQ
MNLGPTQRVVMDLDEGSSFAILTTGQSGHLFHPHRQDLITKWQNVEYHPLLFKREDINAHCEARLRLVPC